VPTETKDPYSATHFGRAGSSPVVLTETWAGSCIMRGVMSYVMGMFLNCSTRNARLSNGYWFGPSFSFSRCYA
jgi:hypothetical protein